jgi:hypothetical protein
MTAPYQGERLRRERLYRRDRAIFAVWIGAHVVVAALLIGMVLALLTGALK